MMFLFHVKESRIHEIAGRLGLCKTRLLPFLFSPFSVKNGIGQSDDNCADFYNYCAHLIVIKIH
ncbi:MAG TPA: hypothetical protein DCR04_04920 [Flavobacteriales bacterium]|nr:hypothetical protein [Flavobacteriales bacterium]